MSYYKICPVCGSHLDPGEKCDCESIEKAPCSNATKQTNTEQQPTKGSKNIISRSPFKCKKGQNKMGNFNDYEIERDGKKLIVVPQFKNISNRIGCAFVHAYDQNFLFCPGDEPSEAEISFGFDCISHP